MVTDCLSDFGAVSRQIDRQTDRQTDRQADRRTGRRASRQTLTQKKNIRLKKLKNSAEV